MIDLNITITNRVMIDNTNYFRQSAQIYERIIIIIIIIKSVVLDGVRLVSKLVVLPTL